MYAYRTPLFSVLQTKCSTENSTLNCHVLQSSFEIDFFLVPELATQTTTRMVYFQAIVPCANCGCRNICRCAMLPCLPVRFIHTLHWYFLNHCTNWNLAVCITDCRESETKPNLA